MINKVILVGNLGKDPEVRRLDSGAVVSNFSVATNENYRDKSGEWQTMTEWHNISIWGPAAERTEQTLKKGNMVYIEGKIQSRKYQDKEGNDRYITEIRALTLRKLDRNQENSESGTNTGKFPPVNTPAVAKEPQAKMDKVEDDLPF